MSEEMAAAAVDTGGAEAAPEAVEADAPVTDTTAPVEGAEAAPGEEAPPEETPAERKFRLKVLGEETELSRDELLDALLDGLGEDEVITAAQLRKAGSKKLESAAQQRAEIEDRTAKLTQVYEAFRDDPMGALRDIHGDEAVQAMLDKEWEAMLDREAMTPEERQYQEQQRELEQLKQYRQQTEEQARTQAEERATQQRIQVIEQQVTEAFGGTVTEAQMNDVSNRLREQFNLGLPLDIPRAVRETQQSRRQSVLSGLSDIDIADIPADVVKRIRAHDVAKLKAEGAQTRGTKAPTKATPKPRETPPRFRDPEDFLKDLFAD